MQPHPPRPLRILILIDELLNLGGTERNLVRLLLRFPPEQFAFHIVTYAFNPEVPSFSQLPFPMKVLPLKRIYTPNGVRLGFQLSRILRQWRIDLVHCFFESSDLWGAPIAKLSGLPVISSRRDMGIHRHRLHNFLYRFVSPHFDQVQAVSSELRRWLIEHDRLDPARVVTMPNGVDLDEMKPSTPAAETRLLLGLPASGRLVTSVANLRQVKGQDTLLEAAARIAPDFPDIHFVLAGTPLESDFVARLHELASRPELAGRVHMPGSVKDVPSLLAASTVFVLPSRSEGMSTALLESMGAALPAIATRTGGNPELVADGTSGLLTPVGDAAALASALSGLLGRPERAAQLGQAAFEKVRAEYSIDSVVTRMAAEYKRISGRGPASGDEV